MQPFTRSTTVPVKVRVETDADRLKPIFYKEREPFVSFCRRFFIAIVALKCVLLFRAVRRFDSLKAIVRTSASNTIKASKRKV